MRKYLSILIILAIITMIQISIFNHLNADLAAKDRQIEQHNREITILKKILAPAPKIEQHIKANSKLDPATAHNVTASIMIESRRNELEPERVTSVIEVESHFNPFAVSKKGAKGLMQITDLIAKVYHCRDVYDIHENIVAGCKYLADLTKRFGRQNTGLILASYNAGPSRPPREILRAAGSYPGKVNRCRRRLMRQ
jgi:soluble lytic murein transglycosylase-like protein